MSKQPPPAPTASAAGPCPTVIQIGEVYPAPSHHPRYKMEISAAKTKLMTNSAYDIQRGIQVGWLVILGLTAL